PQGTLGLRLLSRQGLDPAIEAHAGDTLRAFFAAVPPSRPFLTGLPGGEPQLRDQYKTGHPISQSN
ncbi:hypothetical protein ACFQ08_43835, partial [Streptosporangium algeriense]